MYFLKEKLEAFQAFMEFKALVENQINYTIKALRLNCGVEFTYKKFESFNKNHGI